MTISNIIKIEDRSQNLFPRVFRSPGYLMRRRKLSLRAKSTLAGTPSMPNTLTRAASWRFRAWASMKSETARCSTRRSVAAGYVERATTICSKGSRAGGFCLRVIWRGFPNDAVPMETVLRLTATETRGNLFSRDFDVHGHLRRDRADAASGPAWRAGDHRAHEWLDPELRKLADARARRRLHRGHSRRRLRGSGSLGRGERSDRDRATTQDDVQPESRRGQRCRPDLRRHARNFRRADPAPADAVSFWRRARIDGGRARGAPGGLRHRHHRRPRIVRQRGALPHGVGGPHLVRGSV